MPASSHCWKQHLVTRWTWKTQACAYTEYSPIHSNIFDTEEQSTCNQQRNSNNKPAKIPLTFNGILSAWHTKELVAQNFIGVTKY